MMIWQCESCKRRRPLSGQALRLILTTHIPYCANWEGHGYCPGIGSLLIHPLITGERDDSRTSIQHNNKEKT